MIAIFVMLAGGAGALTRFVVDGLIRTHLGRQFPWGTMFINISGSLLLGMLAGLALRHHELSDVRVMIGTGFCGGYTTFSTMSFETVRLIERRQYSKALFNTVGTLGVALVGAGVGIAVLLLY